jgi:predicted ATPase
LCPEELLAQVLKLLQRQGKRAEAQQLLAEVYGWCTEGFNTDDLQEARALLAAVA